MKIHAQPSSRTVALAVSVLLAASFTSTLTAQETKTATPAVKKSIPAPVVEAAEPTLSPGVAEVIKLTAAGVDAEIIRNFVAHSKTPYALTADDLIALKEKQVPDDVTAAMLLRGQQANRKKQVVKPRIVQQLSTEGEMDPESYEFFQNHYLYPRALSSSYKTLAPFAPQYQRGRSYGASRYGNRGPSRFGSTGPARNDRRGGHYRGGRFGR